MGNECVTSEKDNKHKKGGESRILKKRSKKNTEERKKQGLS
jgi:hypothetical protein